LLKCLLRLVEIQNGDILIDHKTISNIKLSELRLRISIIPQDPILFNGTLRENLDPLSQYSDGEIKRNLKIVKMDEFLELRNENLDMIISNGNNYDHLIFRWPQFQSRTKTIVVFGSFHVKKVENFDHG
jgi:ABC-type multidrug transport system fused ATPase/permease subunit